jgi:hypothetical protein
VGGWYTIGLALGLGLGVGVLLSALVGVSALGLGAALIGGAALGVLLGLALGDTPEVVAGVVGSVLGAISAGTLVYGAKWRGATRFGIAAFVGSGGVLVGLLALIPLVGYLEAALLPLAAARMRSRRAARYAGLRTLAK